MIVAFYPGAGGHRYRLFLQNQHFDKRGGNMHHGVMPVRYADDTTQALQQFDTNKIHLTHTFDTLQIKRIWPGHEIRKIKCDLKKSLCREWEVEMKFHWQHNTHKEQVGQMFDMIVWYHKYYNTPDWECDVLIDIDTDPTEFGAVMRRELDLNNPWIDFAWDCYKQFGENAPIDDLYEKQLLA